MADLLGSQMINHQTRGYSTLFSDNRRGRCSCDWNAQARVERPIHVLSTVHGSASYSFGKQSPQMCRQAMQERDFMQRFEMV